MPQGSPKTNRGPAAAEENRAALLAAARRLFAERGYHVPLSAIAKEAGVGQGSLYRHFPTREDLAAALLDENVDALEGARDAGFRSLWTAVVEQIIESGGFVETVLGSPTAARAIALERRFVVVLDRTLAAAHARGEVAPELSASDVLLVMRMLLGVVHVEPDEAARRRAAHQALALIGRGLQIEGE